MEDRRKHRIILWTRVGLTFNSVGRKGRSLADQIVIVLLVLS